MITNLNKVAKDIIEENEYLTLATVDKDNNPWVSILAYAYDNKYNFYFLSPPNSRHSRHIKINDTIAFSIFDSRQTFGYGVGLQIEGNIKEVDFSEYVTVGDIYMGRKYPYGNTNNTFMEGIKDLLDEKIYLFYQLAPTKCWINDPNADTDKRALINLN